MDDIYIEKEVKSEHTSVRISKNTRKVLDKISEIDSRKISDTTSTMIAEYAPVKLKLVKPSVIPRNIMFGGTSVAFSVVDEDTISMVIDPGPGSALSAVRLSKDDKDEIHNLIANLLLFTNSI